MLPVIRALYLMKNSSGTATTFAHLDTTIVLERSIAAMRIYDGGSAQIDLLALSRRKSSAKSTATLRVRKRCYSDSKTYRITLRFSAWTRTTRVI